MQLLHSLQASVRSHHFTHSCACVTELASTDFIVFPFFSLARTRIAIQMTTAKPNMIRLLTATVLAVVLTMSTNSSITPTYTETKQNENKKNEQAATTQL